MVIGGVWRLGRRLSPAASGGPAFDLVSFPATAAAHPGWYVSGVDHPTPGELEALAARLGPPSRPRYRLARSRHRRPTFAAWPGGSGSGPSTVTPVAELWVPRGAS